MNKKYLSVVLFGALMLGTAGTFTGCIDNDEPAGIEELRGAKAELLKAKAAVEQAKVAYVQAQTAQLQALVQYQELVNKEKELQNQKVELEVKLQEAKTAEQIAAAQAELERINAQLERDRLSWEAQLLTAKQTLAEAQKAYDDAMAALELSKDYLSDAELAQLNHVKNKLAAAKTAMDTAQNGLKTAYDTYKTAVTAPGNYINEATLKEALAVAEANEAKATNKLNLKLQALEALESDENYTAWQALRTEFQNKLDSVNAVIADKETEKAKIIAYEENHSIAELEAAIQAVQNIQPAKVANSNPKAFEVSAAIQDYMPAINNTTIEYNGGKLSIKNFNTAIVGGYKDKDGQGNTTDYTGMLKYNFVFNGSNGYDAAAKAISDAITAVTNAKNGVDPNIPAWAEDDLAAAKKAMDDAKEVSDDAIEAWEKAVADYESGDSYDQATFNEDVASLTAQITTVRGSNDKAVINTAYTKFKTVYNRMLGYGQTFANKTAIDAAIASADAFNTAADAASSVDDFLGTVTYKTVDLLDALTTAAFTAFGDAFKDSEKNVYRVMPTDAYVLANDPDADGVYTQYLKAVQAYNEALAKVNLDDEFDAVLEQLAAWSKTLSDAKTAYEEANKAKLDAVIEGQNTVTEKVVVPIAELKLDVDTDYKTDINDMLAAITNNDDVKEFEALIAKLKKEIGDKKGVDGATASTGLYLKVEEAQDAVLEAEKKIELFNEGNLKEQYIIDWAKEELDRAKATYENAVEEFNYWNDKLEEMMDLLYKGASDQPAA